METTSPSKILKNLQPMDALILKLFKKLKLEVLLFNFIFSNNWKGSSLFDLLKSKESLKVMIKMFKEPHNIGCSNPVFTHCGVLEFGLTLIIEPININQPGQTLMESA
jgi:hypothetical protein